MSFHIANNCSVRHFDREGPRQVPFVLLYMTKTFTVEASYTAVICYVKAHQHNSAIHLTSPRRNTSISMNFEPLEQEIHIERTMCRHCYMQLASAIAVFSYLHQISITTSGYHSRLLPHNCAATCRGVADGPAGLSQG